jgi:hypothetical protein
MKHAILALGAIILAVTAAFAQSIPLKITSPTPTPSVSEAAQTVSGKITRVDAHANTFSLRATNSRKPIVLKAGNEIDIKQLRRGQRVTVTHADGTALQVEDAKPAH